MLGKFNYTIYIYIYNKGKEITLLKVLKEAKPSSRFCVNVCSDNNYYTVQKRENENIKTTFAIWNVMSRLSTSFSQCLGIFSTYSVLEEMSATDIF